MGGLMVSGCRTSHPIPTTSINQLVPSILVIADPQFHNVYGVGVKQMGIPADRLSKVARRSPELNLLAPIVLEDLLKAAQVESVGPNPPVVLAVGDILNIACSGEFDLFFETVSSSVASDSIILLAHGNHDTYLTGTVNSYVPSDLDSWLPPSGMACSPVPTDEHWWGPLSAPSGGWKNWKDACYDSGEEEIGSPMNKSRWLRRYTNILESHGLELAASKQTEPDRHTITYAARKGSRLGSLNFQAEGVWVNPIFGTKPSHSDFQRSYQSFIVQSVDVADQHRLIIIDTSVIENARGGRRYLGTQAGTNARIGAEQFDVIKRMVCDVPPEFKLYVSGHFPIDDLSSTERNRLLGILSSRPGWVYISGHTHGLGELVDWGSGQEINVASTTDWPMEAYRFYFDKEVPTPSVSRFGQFDRPRTSYSPRVSRATSELCRHLPVARELAGLCVTQGGSEWRTPQEDRDCEPKSPKDWQDRAGELRAYRQIIRERYLAEPKYREAVLSIAAGASFNEFESKDLASLAGLLRWFN